MRFRDPSGTVGLTLPAGWSLDIASSTVTELVFATWGGDAKRLFVRLTPPLAADGPVAWVDATRATLPADAGPVVVDVVTTTDGPTPGVWVVRPGREGRPDQRWLIVHGAALDVTLEEVGAARGGRMRTPLLEAAARSLSVPANGPAIDSGMPSWHSVMAAAEAALQHGDRQLAATLLAQAAGRATLDWQSGLRAGATDARQLLPVADSLLGYSQLTGNLRALDDATVLTTRALPGLAGEDQAFGRSLLDAVLQQHAARSGESAPVDPLRAAFVRSRIATKDLENPSDAPFAVELAARCAVFVERMVGTPTPADLVADFREEAVRLLAAASKQATIIRTNAGMRPDPDATDTLLFAAREVYRLEPTVGMRGLLVSALSASARDLEHVGDDASLRTAEPLLAEARGLLDGVDAAGADRVWLGSGWISNGLGRAAEALEFADRVIGQEQQLAALRSTASLALGQVQQALAFASTANGADDAFLEGLAAALLANGRAAEAVEQARVGLLRELPANPFSSTVQSLLDVLGDALERGSALALTATALAADLLDYAPRWESRVDRVAGYDEAPDRRRTAASLVLRLHEAGDDVGALAAADRARARTLAPDFMRTAPGDEQLATVAAPDPGTTVAELLELLGSLIAAQLEAVGIARPASGARLCELITASGRTTLVLHPTPEGLLRILVRPGSPPRVDVRQVDDLDALNRRLAITVAQRGALPDPSEAQVLAALAAWSREPDEPDPADDLSRRVYEQLLGGLDLVPGEPLAVVPYRELALLPLATLTDPSGEPVIAQHPVSTMPSIISALGPATARARESRLRAVVLGDPDVDPIEGLPRLSGARAEAEQVTGLLERQLDVTPLIGADATEAALREHAYGARLLHLACHAAVQQDSDRSTLYLTRAGADDGRFEVREADDLMLDDALVVLAACETGLGRATPDGVNGLGRAFTRAGARCVLLSLWRVGDASTDILMRELYRGLLGLDGAPLDVSAALAQAQLATRARYPDVTQWGPWLLVGDGGWRLD